MPLSRREFLIDGLATGAFSPVLGSAGHRGLGGKHSGYPFQHGVASGDPLTDAIILWTRVTPARTSSASGYSSVPGYPSVMGYQWLVATDRSLKDVVASGEGLTDASRDFTVKIDVRGLSPGREYFYAFYSRGHWSDTGRFKTLPEDDVEHLRIAFTSCSNYAAGYFNVYRELALQSDLDVILHLGDYIYEYASIDESLQTGRLHEPLKETVTLADYRARHACYKADKDSQAVHRQHAFIAIWDDHEVANNAWQGGAANHQDYQGDWSERLNAAVQAYYEWMPVREITHTGRLALYRGYRFGNLLDLSVLDTRLAGRDAPETSPDAIADSQRTLLGFEQEAWLESRLINAQQEDVTWKLLGQQVMMGQFGFQDQPFNYDQWDGYPAARQRLFDVIRDNDITGWGVLTGDIHSSWAMTLHDDPFESLQQPLGFELVTPAVTSKGIGSRAAGEFAGASLMQVLPHLNFVDFYYRGYVLLDITHERLQAQWWVVDRVDSPRYETACLRTLEVTPDSPEFSEAEPVIADSSGADAPVASLRAFSDELAYLREWSAGGEVIPEGMVALHHP